ncbi:MAG: hypothetical protein QXM75_00880 [Candidatus Diapherotrites archaeon]
MRNYQGVKISAHFTDDCQGISIDLSESEFLLGPSYPKFDSNWAKSISIKINVLESTEKNSCEIKFIVEKPSKENSEKWRIAHGAKYYETASTWVSISPTIIVNID